MAEPKPVAEILEDLAFLADMHVGISEAAARTGFSCGPSLDKWLRRHGHGDMVTRLTRYEPIPLPTRKAS